MPNQTSLTARVLSCAFGCGIVSVIIVSFFFQSSNVIAADFPLDFSYNGINDPPNVATDKLEGSCPGASGGENFCTGNDGTQFSQDLVIIDGGVYWHNIIGADGFDYEYYTRSTVSVGTLNFYRNQGLVVQGFVATSPDYGGTTDFGGTDPCVTDGSGFPARGCANAVDPLNVSHDYNFSGTGTGNPSRMTMRMVVDDGSGMSLEVYKPRPENKMLITQTIMDGDMRSEFVSDMRGLSYSDMSSAAPVVNRQAIDDINMPTPGAGDFDMSMVQDSEITSGRFRYTPGLGWDGSFTNFDEGTYEYVDGGFDELSADWESYFNSAENAVACATGNRNNAECP